MFILQNFKRSAGLSLLAALAFSAPISSTAQDFPNKPIHFVVGFPRDSNPHASRIGIVAETAFSTE